MYKCVECDGPVENHMIECATNPNTDEVNLKALLCEACDTTALDLMESNDYADGLDWMDDDIDEDVSWGYNEVD